MWSDLAYQERIMLLKSDVGIFIIKQLFYVLSELLREIKLYDTYILKIYKRTRIMGYSGSVHASPFMF